MNKLIKLKPVIEKFTFGLTVSAGLLIGLMSLTGVATAAQSPSTESVIRVDADGLAPFDGDDNAGHDSAADNDRVRNLDLVTYEAQLSLNDANDSNATLTLTLNDKASWTNLPVECLTDTTPVSELQDSSGDGLNDTLICNLGDHAEGSKLLIYPTAQAVGAEGDVIQAAVSSASDNNVNTGGNATAQSHGPVDTVITAAFSVSLDKSVVSLAPEDEIDYESPYIPASASGNGEAGKLISWHIALNYAAGSELIAHSNGLADFVLTDAWVASSSVTGGTISDTIQPYSFGSGGVLAGCSPVDNTVSYSVTCTQANPGGDVSIAIDGVDVRNAQPFKIQYTMWIPYDEIRQSGDSSASLDIDNTATIISFDPGSGSVTAPLQSISSTPNPGIESDSEDFIVNATTPGPLVYYKSFDGEGGSKSGQRTASAGQLIETSLSIRDHRFYDTRPGLCETIDTANFEFAGVDPVGVQKDSYYHGQSSFAWGHREERGMLHQHYNPIIRTSDPQLDHTLNTILDARENGVIVEYSDSLNTPSHWEADCSNSHHWVGDYNSLAGGVASVTKVRVKWKRDFEDLLAVSHPAITASPLFHLFFSFNLRVRDTPAVSMGELIPNVATRTLDYTTDAWLNPLAESGSYAFTTDPASPLYSFNTKIADRVLLVAANMGITKTLNPTNLGAVKSGDTVHFSIDPYTNGTTGSPVTLTLTDTLPDELSYVTDTCASVIAGCTVDLSALPDTISWTIPNHTTGDDLPAFDLETVVSTPAAAGTYINKVGILSDNTNLNNDSFPDDLSDTANISIVGVNGLRVRKTVTPSQQETTPDRSHSDYTSGANDFTFSLHYENAGGADTAEAMLIDVLPYNGDSADSVIRDPASSFSGDFDFVSFSGDGVTTTWYSTDDPATISHQPCHPDNWPAGTTSVNDAAVAATCPGGLLDGSGDTDPATTGTGATGWISGLPASDADRQSTTAIRAAVSAFPADESSRSIELVMRGAGNTAGDIYCNNYAFQSGSLDIDTISNDVCVTVVAKQGGSITWVKDTSTDSADVFEFSGDNSGVATTFQLSDDGSGSNDRITWAGLDAGTYSATESTLPTDWSLSRRQCFGGSNSNWTTSGNDGIEVTLADGEHLTCVFSNADACAVPATDLLNTAIIYSDAVETNHANNAAQACVTTASGYVDLELTKTASTTSVVVGESFSYTLSLYNAGPGDATGIEVRDQLPAEVTYSSDTPSQGTYTVATGIWAVGDLAAGQTVTLKITVTVDYR